MAEVPSAKDNQPGWLRYPHKFRAAIRGRASEHALIANNRIPRSGEANFVMKDFQLEDRAKQFVSFDVLFDYDNRPGIYLNHHCVGSTGGSGNDGTLETHPWGFRKGLACVNNYVFATGRCVIGFCGDGVICLRNTIRFAKDVPRPAPKLAFADLDLILQRADARTPGLEVKKLQNGEGAYLAPGMVKAVRITTCPDYFDDHSDSFELWSPGSSAFPKVDDVADVYDLNGITIHTLLKPITSPTS